MRGLLIRPARRDDIDLVARISRAAYAVYIDRLGREPKPMVEDYAVPIERGDVSVLEIDGAAAGVLVVRDAPDHLLIYSIALDPSHQGRGLGQRLMRYAEDTARRRAHPEVRLYTNEIMTENIAFYSRLGYVESARRPHELYPASVLVFMAKRV